MSSNSVSGEILFFAKRNNTKIICTLEGIRPHSILQPNFKHSAPKKYLLSLVLLAYVVGTFHQEVFELVHALGHQFTGGYSYHSHHSDSEEPDHEHFIADFSKITFEQWCDSPIRKGERLHQSVNKIPQICPSIVLLTNLGKSKNKHNPFFNLQLPPSPFLQMITPPPDCTG